MLQDLAVPFRQVGGITYTYDMERSRWVSLSRETFWFSVDHSNVGSRWMNYNCKVPSNVNGQLITRDSVITAVHVLCGDTATANFSVKNALDTSLIYLLSLVGNRSKVVDNLNIELEAGDILQVYLDVPGAKIDYPVMGIEVGFRQT